MAGEANARLGARCSHVLSRVARYTGWKQACSRAADPTISSKGNNIHFRCCVTSTVSNFEIDAADRPETYKSSPSGGSAWGKPSLHLQANASTGCLRTLIAASLAPCLSVEYRSKETVGPHVASCSSNHRRQSGKVRSAYPPGYISCLASVHAVAYSIPVPRCTLRIANSRIYMTSSPSSCQLSMQILALIAATGCHMML